MAKRTVTRRTRPSAPRMGRGDASANIPLQVAYSQRQPVGRRSHMFMFSDMIGSIAVGSTTPVGQIWEYPLNPVLLPGSRIANLAQNFQKFRFKRMRISVGVNMPTSISGTYIVGYCENPDQAFSAGLSATQQAYALPQAVNKPWWQRADSNATLYDRNKWYNIDADSAEVMMTTQGKFVICNVSPPTIVGSEAPISQNVPIFIEYEVEMAGSAVQTPLPDSTPIVWPGGTFTSIGIEGTYEFVAAPGEIPTPAITYQQAYLANPTNLLTDEGEEKVVARVFAKKITVPTDRYCFYASIDDFNNDNFFKFPVGDVQILPRTTIISTN